MKILLTPNAKTLFTYEFNEKPNSADNILLIETPKEMFDNRVNL